MCFNYIVVKNVLAVEFWNLFLFQYYTHTDMVKNVIFILFLKSFLKNFFLNSPFGVHLMTFDLVPIIFNVFMVIYFFNNKYYPTIFPRIWLRIKCLKEMNHVALHPNKTQVVHWKKPLDLHSLLHVPSANNRIFLIRQSVLLQNILSMINIAS